MGSFFLSHAIFERRSLRDFLIADKMGQKNKAITVKDVNQQLFTTVFARFLKRSGKVKEPEWADHVKTGLFKELAPFDPDWFYIRTAALARHTYMRSPVGVGAARRIFGGPINRGSIPSHYKIASGAILRKAFQALESMKLVEKSDNGGRKISAQGYRDLNRIAAQIKAPSHSPRARKIKAAAAKGAGIRVVKTKNPKTAAKKVAKPAAKKAVKPKVAKPKTVKA